MELLVHFGMIGLCELLAWFMTMPVESVNI